MSYQEKAGKTVNVVSSNVALPSTHRHVRARFGERQARPGRRREKGPR
ncbi:MAG TPA: hypothetical protein VFH16_11935 [Rubrobacter sp.]|nr:hypothetical protein [Rubrobacter sp.]